MNKNLYILFFLIVLFVGIISCKKEKDELPDMGYNYFPDDVGSYVVYDVDSIYYDDFNNTVDTFKFQLKHKIESLFTDNQGRQTQRIERYVKMYNPSVPYSSMQWTLRDVWAANKSTTNAEQVEENLRFVKLAFPVTETQKWNGNAQNTLSPWNYSYNFFDLPRTRGNILFDSVLEVKQYNQKSLIEYTYYIEQYARNTGMIYKRVIDVESQPAQGLSDSALMYFYGLDIMNRIKSGFQYTYTINSFGKE